jgi:hypothetical protein
MLPQVVLPALCPHTPVPLSVVTTVVSLCVSHQVAAVEAPAPSSAGRVRGRGAMSGSVVKPAAPVLAAAAPPAPGGGAGTVGNAEADAGGDGDAMEVGCALLSRDIPWFRQLHGSLCLVCGEGWGMPHFGP